VIRWVGTIAVAFLLLGAGSAEALTLTPVGGDFDQPTYVTADPANLDRLYVVEREGRIKLVEGGVVSVFADLSAAVACGGACGGERGLLSIAPDPEFAANGRLYAYYADDVQGKIHVDELIAAPDRRSASVAGALIAPIDHSESATHYGGQLQFGPDGHLYVSTGDGGGANGQFHHAQNPADPLGKILRVDPDVAGKPVPYDVWSLGLRNPFRFSFDSLRGSMVIGDVGQQLREEIDFAPSPAPGVVGGDGANYGWNCREGLLAGPATDVECLGAPASAFVDPVFDYGHSPDPDSGEPRCAVIGGYVARDPGLEALYGSYVYTDHCSGTLRALRLPVGAGAASGDCSLDLQVESPVSFGEDSRRRLYVVEKGGAVSRLVGAPPADCPPRSAPQPEALPQLLPTFVGIKAQRRRVERGKTAVLTVWVSPCRDRKGDVVALLRNGRRNGSRFLSRACTARFLRRVHRNTRFTAITHRENAYLGGQSRRLKIRIAPRRRG
jgi:Glucose / Sorbosone dehydrogenase